MRQRCCDCAFCFKFAGSVDCNYGNVYAPISIRNPKIKSMYQYNNCPKYEKRNIYCLPKALWEIGNRLAYEELKRELKELEKEFYEESNKDL